MFDRLCFKINETYHDTIDYKRTPKVKLVPFKTSNKYVSRRIKYHDEMTLSDHFNVLFRAKLPYTTTKPK